ncbi:glycoside hydrolase family 26 protein [Streptomyces liangshanensis]|uniref:glycoside hydrolase family 26 protein n=1 Tax=Streptomyces liangshanensis TaxID=2717324 RepID=UPI0036DECE9D
MSRRRRLASTCLGAVTAGLLATGAGLPSPAATTGPVDPPDPKPPQAPAPAFGAYLDYGPRGVRRIAEMQKWLGGTELRVGHTYLPGDVWSNIEGSPSFVADWAEWRKAKADRMFVLNVPMLERNEGRVPDYVVRRELQRGATGAYDGHFRALAERLVGLGVPDTVIVLGWEMNGTTYTHRCGPDPESWKKYWRSIVTTMRAVPGQKFRFDWAPNRGEDAVPWTRCYPGDDVVDIIGMDSYDQPPGRTFDEQVNEPYGLKQHVDFAAAHKKVVSYPEWGLYRNGDNPTYMRRMLEWIDTHQPIYNTVTDYCPHGVWQCDKNPQSSKVFRSMLYGRLPEPAPTPPVPTPTVPTPPVPTPTVPTPPVPTPTVPTPPVPTPTTPTPPPVPPAPPTPDGCTPMNLGSWVESWLGGKLCLRVDWWERKRS